MNALIKPELLAELEKLKGPFFEKNIPFMYVDTTKNVTVGVGHNLTFHKDVKKLEFVIKRYERHAVLGGDMGTSIVLGRRSIGREATEEEKQNDFDFLSRHPRLGEHAPDNGHMARYTTLELPQTAINTLFESDLISALKIARQKFGATFDTYAIGCQAALVDIAFNSGSFIHFSELVSVIHGYGKYKEMSLAERWREAAKEKNCSRPAIPAQRVQQRTAWLSSGATA
jgi:hypothetical protein